MSAENRAAQKMRRQQYRDMPTREVFTAAAEYEKAKQSNVNAIDTSLVQRAQFAGMVLGNPEVQKALSHPEFEKLAHTARDFFKAFIEQSTRLVAKRDEMDREEDEGEGEDGSDDTLHAV